MRVDVHQACAAAEAWRAQCGQDVRIAVNLSPAQLRDTRFVNHVRDALHESAQPLLGGEAVSKLASAATLFDIANGMAVRVDPTEVAYPNLDLTVHLFDEPRTEWLGFDTSVSFGRNGIGLTHTILHDERGPVGSVSQILTVRP
mgnify:CR=1 FL=1